VLSIHNLGLVGHIEDIAVTKNQQGKKLGLRIIEALDYVAKKVGCYKVSSVTGYLFSGAIAGQTLLWQTHRGLCKLSVLLFRSRPQSYPSSAYPPCAPSPPDVHTKLTFSFPADNSRLLRDERRLLRQMRLQEGRTRDGALLQSGLTARRPQSERLWCRNNSTIGPG